MSSESVELLFFPSLFRVSISMSSLLLDCMPIACLADSLLIMYSLSRSLPMSRPCVAAALAMCIIGPSRLSV